MRKTRATLAVPAASALLLAAPLLTACGNDAHPGAAAVVDGDRITVSQLQAQVNDVRDAQRDSPKAEQLVANSGGLSQNTLIRMIQFRVIERAAQDNGVRVTRRDVRQCRQAVEARGGGDVLRALQTGQTTKCVPAGEAQSDGAAALRDFYLEQGIAPSRVDDALRMELLRNRLVAKLGVAKVNEVFARTSKELAIDVNPRYGKWDDKRGTAVLTKEAWLRTSGDESERA
ncbi:SurA N-terminal domain-containing protein [Streptomyces sparsogenes]|uniref:Lipoprotein n=1 Tax=Streptomyces sparsogenes DSM 40356 TaxID=1331668 RepID=A0A1R1S5L3_9ACTN|nr:SurA N-terminal domain-containing protein [Streptomyces sparsogenes]OMI33580.1 lipoprotein [Streptomyces sparsogenes DSM 40356]